MRPLSETLRSIPSKRSDLPSGALLKTGHPSREANDASADAARRQRQEKASAEARQLAEEEAAREAAARRAAEIAELRAVWAMEEGARIAERLSEMVQDMETRLAAIVAEGIGPVLSEVQRDLAIHQFTDCLQDALASSPSAEIRLSGPQDLVAALKARWPERLAGAAITLTGGRDIAAAVGALTIETRIAAWADRLRLSIGGVPS